jgi:hypothetical protein
MDTKALDRWLGKQEEEERPRHFRDDRLVHVRMLVGPSDPDPNGITFTIFTFIAEAIVVAVAREVRQRQLQSLGGLARRGREGGTHLRDG